MKSRVLSLLLTIALCLTLLPAPARAANPVFPRDGGDVIALEGGVWSGDEGGTITWDLATRTLTLENVVLNVTGGIIIPEYDSTEDNPTIVLIGENIINTSAAEGICIARSRTAIKGNGSLIVTQTVTIPNETSYVWSNSTLDIGSETDSPTIVFDVKGGKEFSCGTNARIKVINGTLRINGAEQACENKVIRVDGVKALGSSVLNAADSALKEIDSNSKTCTVNGARCRTLLVTSAVPSTAVTLADAMVSVTGGAYTGTPIAPAVTVTHNGTALTAGTDYTLSGDTSATAAGTYSLTVTGQGDYSGAVTKQWTITPIPAPVTTWPTIAQVYVNDTLTDSALSGGASSVPGSFSITGTKTWSEAGSKTTTLTFTPADTTNYTPATKSDVAVSVIRRTVTSVENLSAITGKPYGTAQSDLGLPTAVTLTASGKIFENVPVTWTGYNANSTAPQTLVGTLDLSTIAAEVEQPEEAVTASISVTLSAKTTTAPTFLTKSTPYTGDPIPHELVKPEGVASVSYEYEGTSGTHYVKSLTAPTNAGTYTVTATFTMSPGYAQLNPATSTLTITQISAPVTTWPTISQIYVNDTLTDSALSGGASSIDGSFSITGTKTWSAAGSKTTTLTFTPADTTNYTPATQENVSVSVVKRTVMSVENLSAITGKPYGTAQSDLGLPTTVALTASGKIFENVPVTWTGYNSTSTAPQTLVGTLDLSAIAAEVEQPTTEITASISVTLSAKTATAPTFEPKSTPYTGEPIPHELVKPEGVASVSYEYEGTSGTHYVKSLTAPTNAGTYTVTATFTMSPGYAQLDPVTSTLTIIPIPAPVTTWPTISRIYVNDTLTNSVLSGGASSVDGSFSITGAKTWNTHGSKTTALTFTPTDTTNYTPATKSDVAVSVVKRTVMSVENLSAITGKPYGTAQSDLGLPTAVTLTASGKIFENVPVTWTGYNANSTAPQTLVGTLDLSAIAAEVEQPEEAVTASISVTLSAKTATAPTFLTKSTPYTGDPIPHELVKPEGVASVSYEYEGTSGTHYVKSTTVPTNAGTYTVTATFTMADGYAQLDPVTSTLTISKATFAASVSMADYTCGADVPSPRVSANPENGAVTCYYHRADGGAATKWENITATTLSPGTYRLYAVIAETANYQSCTTDPVEFTVAAAPAPVLPPPASPAPIAPAPSAPEPDEDEPDAQQGPDEDEPDEQQADAPAAPFVDVPPEAYYADAVAWAAQNGITGGVGEDCFAPAQSCSRAQIVTFLWRVAGSPEPAGETPLPGDVPHGDYYTRAVRWAIENGIALGMDGGFSPDGSCTRAQAMMFLYRCAMLRGDAAEARSQRVPFTDVPAWCYESVAWCYAQGITSGTGDDTFSPDEPCTRAQIVTLLHRFCGMQ